PEEVKCPMILHQKLSAAMAQRFFGVDDKGTLSAICCHTTLRRDAALLDKIVFLADKIRWDQSGEPPYLPNLVAALGPSLDAAVCVYLGYLWERRNSLAVVHPWLAAAYCQLCAQEGRCL
ncbi:MAG: HAD family hydrolase, partial [Anaerolineae bacterium]